MKSILYNEALTAPKLSFVLLDWNCRESFHSLDYLAQQDVPRGDYEIVWIEYYDRRAAEIDRRVAAAEAEAAPPPVDNWIVMEMPADVYYHKHLMYNVGIAQARGEIVVICDSDAMFEPSFVRTVTEAFAADPGIVLHIDEVRSARRDFYPFNYPGFNDVKGSGVLNWREGKTTGLWDEADPLHSRNYGACLCAWRRDMVAIGGADEHLDYLGHICGPYELTFRLVNFGRREVWHQTHFIYHTWHPGTDGHNNYIGPNDGRGMSKTALAIRQSGRVAPLRENEAIRLERTGAAPDRGRSADLLVDPEYARAWSEAAVATSNNFALFSLPENAPKLLGEFKTCNVVSCGATIWAVPRYLGKVELDDPKRPPDPRIRHAPAIEAAIAMVEQGENDARCLFGEGARYDIVDYNGEWLAIPHSVGLIDPRDPAQLEGRGVLRAANREELAIAVLTTRFSALAEFGADLKLILDQMRAPPAPPISAANGSGSRAGKAVDPSTAAFMARLDEIAAQTLALADRMDRIGALAEQALFGLADLRQRGTAPSFDAHRAGSFVRLVREIQRLLPKYWRSIAKRLPGLRTGERPRSGAAQPEFAGRSSNAVKNCE